MSTLVYDIEVAGTPWEDVDAATREYLLAKARDDAERESLPERMALFAGLGKIVAIGIWSVDAGRGLLLLEGEPAAQEPWPRVPDTEIFRGSEADLLRKFWEITSRQNPRFVTYNGRGYDGPVVMVRSAQLGIACLRDLVGNRFDVGAHCDLMDVLSFFGARREHYSLDYWCRRFGVASPKSGLDGSQVGAAYRAGRIEEIGEYCLRDVEATAKLYQKLAPTVIHLLRGGPRAAPIT